MKFHINDDDLFRLYGDGRPGLIISDDISLEDYIELLAKFELAIHVVERQVQCPTLNSSNCCSTSTIPRSG